MKVLPGLLMVAILLLQQFPANAVSVQVGTAKRLSISGGHSSTEINQSRRARKTTGCLAPDVEAIEINNNVFHLKNSPVPKTLKGLFRKFFFKKSGNVTFNGVTR